MKTARNWALFTVVVLIWGTNWVVMKSGLKLVGPLNFVMQRFLFSFIALSPFLVFRQHDAPKDRSTWMRLLLHSILNTLSMLSTNIGLVYEQSGISAVLTYTQPLFVFCLAVPILKEVLTGERFLGVTIGFLGVLVLYLKRILSSSLVPLSLGFLLTGAFLWAISIVYYKRFLSYVNPVLTNAAQFTVGLILLSFLAAAFEGFSFVMSGTYLLMLLYMSIMASAMALTLWVSLLREEEATVISASSFVIPMVALIFGWIFLQETIEMESIMGFALILAGTYLVNKKVPSSPVR